eukprot:TRINITY_DN8265_c0_g1_i3.p2 TRINITY_DN8265_c0_g1~~TRINITY_DN8265_c0_g1_i3.p2  ORF type:complete len:238 (-),score=78.54 TRINITY_DN8265_c0_g1_i3:166-795(-)
MCIRDRNYIMAFLLTHTKNEDLAFNCFAAMQNAHCGEIYVKEMKNFQLYIFIFSKLIAVYLPDLSGVLKKEEIDTQYYATSWFFSLFTNVLHVGRKSSLVLQILDVFVLYGWKGMMQVFLIILEAYKDEIMKMEYETILKFFGGILKRPPFIELEDYKEKDPEFDYLTDIKINVKARLQHFNFDDQVIEIIKKDYETQVIKIKRLREEF